MCETQFGHWTSEILLQQSPSVKKPKHLFRDHCQTEKKMTL